MNVLVICLGVLSVLYIVLVLIGGIIHGADQIRRRREAEQLNNYHELSFGSSRPRRLVTPAEEPRVAVSSAPAPAARPATRISQNIRVGRNMDPIRLTVNDGSQPMFFPHAILVTPRDATVSISYDVELSGGTFVNMDLQFKFSLPYPPTVMGQQHMWTDAVYSFIQAASYSDEQDKKDYYSKLFLLLACMAGAKVSGETLSQNGLSPQYISLEKATAAPPTKAAEERTDRKMRL